MWEDAGLVRDAEGLGHAASVLAGWRAQARAPRTEPSSRTRTCSWSPPRSSRAAQARRESVGAHFRSDDPGSRPADAAAAAAAVAAGAA